MNTLIPIFLLLSLPIILQVSFGNKAFNNVIKLPFWAVCLLNFLLLTIVTVINVFITGTIEIIVFGLFTGILLIVLIAIQSYVFFVNGDNKSK